MSKVENPCFCQPPRFLFRQSIINGKPDILASVYIEMTDRCKCIPVYANMIHMFTLPLLVVSFIRMLWYVVHLDVTYGSNTGKSDKRQKPS